MNFWMISVIWLLFSMLVLNLFGQFGETMPVRTFIVRVLVKYLIMIAFPVVLVSEILWDVISDRIHRNRNRKA